MKVATHRAIPESRSKIPAKMDVIQNTGHNIWAMRPLMRSRYLIALNMLKRMHGKRYFCINYRNQAAVGNMSHFLNIYKMNRPEKL